MSVFENLICLTLLLLRWLESYIIWSIFSTLFLLLNRLLSLKVCCALIEACVTRRLASDQIPFQNFLFMCNLLNVFRLTEFTNAFSINKKIWLWLDLGLWQILVLLVDGKSRNGLRRREIPGEVWIGAIYVRSDSELVKLGGHELGRLKYLTHVIGREVLSEILHL